MQQVLALFPERIHPLMLVSDPDGLLQSETVLVELTRRGYRFIQEPDPIRFRLQIEQAKPFTSQAPLLVITPDALETLPYDLWQTGRHIHLSLNLFYPNLAYPLLQQLTPQQAARLEGAPRLDARLGRQASADYLLRYVFLVEWERWRQPVDWVVWLERYHNQLAPLPEELRLRLLTHVSGLTEIKDLPIAEWLLDGAAFRAALQAEWSAFIGHLGSGARVSEIAGRYGMAFGQSSALQDAVPRLVRMGVLQPIKSSAIRPMPGWAAAGIVSDNADLRAQQAHTRFAQVQEGVADISDNADWREWQNLALAWADWQTTLFHPDLQPALSPQDVTASSQLQQSLDETFLAWLRLRYAALAVQKLPTPHHLYHIPHYINYLRDARGLTRAALIVMDGMSLSDWRLIRPVWQTRHPHWQMHESSVMAQIPSLTAVSRRALISGLSPREFWGSTGPEQKEGTLWQRFWARFGLPASACHYQALHTHLDNLVTVVSNAQLRMLCLVERQLDEMMHGAVLGNPSHMMNVQLWLSAPNPGHATSAALENLLDRLLEEGYTLFMTSDHGHCQADGMGKLSEGLIVDTSAMRARVYSDSRAAASASQLLPDTTVWEHDGLLPEKLAVVLPTGRQAFTSVGETLVTHGGATIDEIVVPFVEVTSHAG